MDTLSSLMEVKLDIRERRTEWLPLRSWTRCYIKIEAIKCFPCYMKITFHKTSNENDGGLVLRINIPGLEIYPVKSRTKEFAYGLYWKQNRKNCIAFLSLDSRLGMEAHMRWVECQIQNLEIYRREILQSSRCSRVEQSLIDGDDCGIYQNMNETCTVRDVNDILGPLPQVPNDNDKNWSRRQSAFSGIYEEIMEPSSRTNNVRGSAIYEEMRLNRPEPTASPPPLPPRVRKNTDCSSLQRSYTTPESEMVKKKWNLFENVFGKSKRSEAKRRERPSTHPLPRELQLLKTKRNSFSSPDLSHLDASFNNSGCANCSFDLDNPSNISSSNSYELENLREDEAEDQVDSNISCNIQPNFKLPLNSDMSSVNLVGSNYNLNHFEDSSPKSQPATSPPGYLEMRPGRGFDMKKVEELDNQLKNDVLYRLKYSFDSPINYKRDYDHEKLPPVTESFYINDRRVEPYINDRRVEPYINDRRVEPVYVCMNGSKASPKIPPRAVKPAEPTYMPMTGRLIPSVVIESHQNVQNCEIESTKARNKRHSVDEKIASYYPNYDVPAKCNNSPLVRSVTTEERSVTSPIQIPSRKTKRVGSFNVKSYNDKNNNNGDVKSPEISKKYATLSRMSAKNPSDDLLSPSTIKKSGSISPTSIKRFSTLQRFRKIDFSPLRLKISSVLQRNNAGGC